MTKTINRLIKYGLNFAGVFLGFVIAYLAISNLAGDKIDSVGKMVKSIVVSMGLMVGVVKLVSKLEPGEMGKGAAFAAVFAGFVWLLVKITKSNEKIMDGLGKLLLSVSTSMLIMVGVAKLAGQLSMGEIVKAIAFAGAFLLFIKALKKITTDSGTGETVKLAGTVLAVSVAIGILAGIAVLLGLVDTKQLVKGVLAVTLLGAIMTGMIWATRGANDVKGNVIAMAVAIGVMAAAVAALSMIDSTKLAIATACLGSLMGMFALMELAGSKAKGSIATIATMIIAVAALAGILGVMSALQVENALPNALALSTLLLSLSVSMVIIGKVGTISAKALISVGVMTLVVAALAGILYLIRDLNPESSIGNAEALSMLLLSLSASCGILAAVGLAGTAGFVGIGVLAALIAAVGAIVVAIGALVKKFPQLEEFLDKGIPILQKIGYALGSFLGNIVGGFTEGATSGLPGVGKNLSDFMTNAQPFIDGAKGIDSSVTTGITSLCKAILALTGTDFLNVIASVFSRGNVSFVKMGEQLKPFGEALSDYAQSVNSDTYACSIRAYCVDEKNDLIPGVTLAIYRRDYTGELIEIASELDNSSYTYVTDPHPALDYGRYRIVATEVATGAVSYYDVPPYPIKETSIIIQWEEAWDNLVTEGLNERDIVMEPLWSGSLVKLPYNIDVSDKNGVDVSLVEYIGRKRPVSYYGTQLGETSSWKTEIPRWDIDTLYALRRLAVYTGDVYIREPSGTGYWANVAVSISQTHCEVKIPVSFDITRVEGGI